MKKKFNQKEAHKKLMYAFQKAFEVYVEQGGDLRDLCWNEFDTILKSMFPKQEDRLILKNRNKAWEVYKAVQTDRKVMMEGYGV